MSAILDEARPEGERVPRRIAPLRTSCDALQLAVFEQIDGRRSIAEIARAVDLDVGRVSAVLSSLAARRSVVFDHDGREVVEPFEGAIVVDDDNAFVVDEENERATFPEIDPLAIFDRPTRPDGEND